MKCFFTFPESTKAFILVDVFVGLHGAAVATGYTVQVHLGLESNLDHICGLCKGHCHGTRSAAGQDTNQHTRVWRRKNQWWNITQYIYSITLIKCGFEVLVHVSVHIYIDSCYLELILQNKSQLKHQSMSLPSDFAALQIFTLYCLLCTLALLSVLIVSQYCCYVCVYCEHSSSCTSVSPG